MIAGDRFFVRSPASVRTIAFAFVAALLAAVVMSAMETPVIDAGAYQIAVALAAVVGCVAALAAEKLGAAAVVVAGALFGMAVQALLFARMPVGRDYFMTADITTRAPVEWVVAGAPLGAVPALFAAALHWAAMQASRTRGRPAPQDVTERVLLPIAGAAAVLSGIALAGARRDAERAGDLVVMLLACAALVAIVRTDRARMRWLERVFAEADPTYVLLPVDVPDHDLPLVVGGVVPAVVIARAASSQAYRATARERYAAAGISAQVTVRPLARRIAVASALAAAAPVSAFVTYLAG